MKKVNKILLGLLLAAPAATAMSGCGMSVESDFRPYDVEKDGDPTQLSAKVTFWHTMSQQGRNLLQEQIKEFNKIYPNITIEESNQGDYNGVRDKLRNAIPAGTTPTMAFCYPDHVAEYINSGASEEMGQYAQEATIGFGKDSTETGGVDDFVSSFWAEGQIYQNPGIYSLPYAKSTEALFYNKTEFDKHGYSVPKTWDELWTLCRQIKQDYASVEGFVPIGIDSDSNYFITLCEQYEIPFTTDKGTEHYLFDNDKAKAKIAELKGYFDEHLFITEGTSENNNKTSNRFIKGAAQNGSLMSIGSTGGTSYNWPGAPSEAFEVAVAVPPTRDITKPKVITQGPSVTFFKRNSLKEKYAGWLFYKWISNTANSASYAVLTGYEPVRESSYNDPIYTEVRDFDDPEIKFSLYSKVYRVTETMKNSYFTSPVFVGSAKARDAVGGIIPAVMLNQKSIDQAFDDALTECVFSNN